MQIIDADPDRLIDLPGVGPCPRPVDIDQSVTGFSRLKSLRIYRFPAGVTIHGDSEVDEVYIVPLDGELRIAITGAHPAEASLSPDGNRALYMTPEHSYRLEPGGDMQVAYARAAAEGRVPTHVETRDTGDRAEHLALVLANLADGEVLETHRHKERLVHVAGGNIIVGGTALTAPQTLALPAGEAADIRGDGAAFVLMVSA